MTTATLNTAEVVEKVQRSAKKMQEMRECPEMKVGQFARQGDIYIERISSISKEGKEVKSHQLAPGTSKGSRHVVQAEQGVKIFQSAPNLGARALFQVGPAIEAACDFVISHPEHAWMKMKKGLYQIWYQLDFHRKERVKD